MAHRWKIPGPVKVLLVVFLVLSFLTGCLYIAKNPLVYHDANYSYMVENAGRRIAFIIPGAGETEDRFKTIEGYYRDVGITPLFINVDWRLTRFTDFIRDGSEEISKAASLYPDRDYYFFGFSFGAVVALCNAEKYQSKGTILCSLSPVMGDDLQTSNDPAAKTIGRLINFTFPGYLKIPEETAVFLYGDHDNKMILSLAEKREAIYPKSEFEVVPGGSHDITGAAYQEKIKQEIYELKEADKNEP